MAEIIRTGTVDEASNYTAWLEARNKAMREGHGFIALYSGSWCEDCRRVLPDFERFATQYEGELSIYEFLVGPPEEFRRADEHGNKLNWFRAEGLRPRGPLIQGLPTVCLYHGMTKAEILYEMKRLSPPTYDELLAMSGYYSREKDNI